MYSDDKSGVTSIGRELGDLRRRLLLVVLLSGGGAVSMAFTVLIPILPRLAVHFGGGALSVLAAQLCMTMPCLGIIGGGLASGWLVSRMGVRWMLLASLAGFGLFGSVGGLLSDIWGFSLSRFAVGISVALLTTASMTSLTKIYDGSARSRIIGYCHAMMGLSGVVVLMASGTVAQTLGWRASFMLFAVLALPAALIALFTAPRDRIANAEPLAMVSAQEERKSLWRLWPILLLVFLLHMIYSTDTTQAPFVLAGIGVASPSAIGLVLGIATILAGLGSIISGHLQSRFGERPVLLGGVLAAGLGCVAVGLSSSVVTFALGKGLMSLGCGIFLPLYMILPLSRVLPAARGATIGLVQVAINLSLFVTPLGLAPLRPAFGSRGCYLIVGELALLAAATAIVIAPLRARWSLASAGRP
jgi:MFS family permease